MKNELIVDQNIRSLTRRSLSTFLEASKYRVSINSFHMKKEITINILLGYFFDSKPNHQLHFV